MSRMQCARLVLLGEFRLELGGATVPLCLPAQRLVADLAVRGPTIRTTAAGRLWPDAAEARARGNLRTALWRLARCSPGLLQRDPERLVLSPSVTVDVDDLRAAATRVIDPDRGTDADVRILRRSTGDELLPGWCDDWVVFERERLRQLRLHALESAALRLGRQGRCGQAVDLAWRAITEDPLRESAHRTLIVLHLMEDNVSEAVRQLAGFRALCRAEIGVDASDRLRELVARAARCPTTARACVRGVTAPGGGRTRRR